MYPPQPAYGSRFPLHTGVSGCAKASVGCSLVIAALGIGLLSALLAALVGAASREAGFVVGVLAFLLLGCLLPGLVLSGMLRNAAWLEHTTLVVRGAFGARRCDLAVARISVDAVAEYTSTGNGITVPTGRRIPRLCALDPWTGKQIRLHLHNPATRNLLEPHKLGALANAIDAGRRPEPDASYARKIAAGLRAMANDPFAGLR